MCQDLYSTGEERLHIIILGRRMWRATGGREDFLGELTSKWRLSRGEDEKHHFRQRTA